MSNLRAIPFVLTATSFFSGGGQHSASFKSIGSADRECFSISRDPNCAARCRGLVTRYWNDTAELPDATVSRFYDPRGCSYCFGGSTTNQCLHELKDRIPAGDGCSRDKFAVNCYDPRDSRDELKFIPFADVERVETLRKCVEILQLSGEVVSDLARNGIVSRPEGRCLFRCFLIRSGLYSDSEGPILDRINVQCASGYGQEVDLRQVESCVVKVRSECGIDKCLLALRTVVECFQVGLDITPASVGFIPYGVNFQKVVLPILSVGKHPVQRNI